MRGRSETPGRLFYTIDVQARIRADHPLRAIKLRVDRLLADLSPRFERAYAAQGRPSVPPERLLKALLLQALYSIRSETQLIERIDTDLLFRWFLDLDPDSPVFDATAFTHNRPRLAEHGLLTAFFDAVLREAWQAGLCSDHFSVDGTLIESYASTKSFQPIPAPSAPSAPSAPAAVPPAPEPRPPVAGDGNSFKPRNPEVDFHGQRRTNATHRSTTDPEARLYRKGYGQEAKLCHMGHALVENRHGLVLAVQVTEANGHAEIDASLAMLDALHARHGKRPTTLGADKGYDSGPYYLELEARGVEPHSAMVQTPPADPKNVRGGRRAAVAARERMKARQQTVGYTLSQRCRKKAEECFGWLKQIAGLARTRLVGRTKIGQQLELAAAAFNLVRLRRLHPA